MNGEAAAVATDTMKTLQRVYQITPTHEAMPTMMSLGLTSAYDVTALPFDVFMQRHGRHFTTTQTAELVYRKAAQVSSVTYNLFTIAQQLDSDVPVYGMAAPAPVKASVKDALIKHYPTMESLFGSLDYCECEHCRSVLSPAAYLVDLLQFIDPDSGVWGNFLRHWEDGHGEAYTARYLKPYDALVERRPDLPHLALTCENTLTAMPYIDLVNEILEYYVANGKLAKEAARDTGDVTTAELLAEPQNVTVGAYAKLAGARYPIGLPFDLPLETVRRVCDFFDTPLARVLEAFRSGDELFAPAKPFDRKSVFIESLGLSPAEYAIFVDPDPLSKWHELYGFTSAADATTVAQDDAGQRIDLNSAKALSRRLAVTYKELVEIVQTWFVNPKLADLAVLHKLGVDVRDVLAYGASRPFFAANRDLLGKARDTLSAADQVRFDALKKADWERLGEVQAFEQRLDKLSATFRAHGFDAKAWVTQALQDQTFDDVLVLADPDTGCDFDATTLRYAGGKAADPIVLLKINLFVRLWRKLGWTIEETDRALQALIPKNAPFDAAHLAQAPLASALIGIAHLATLNERLHVGKDGRAALVTLWSDLATTGKQSPYARLFLAASVLRTDDVFDDPLGRYLSASGLEALARSRTYAVQRDGVKAADRIDPAPFAAEPKLALVYDPLQEVQRLTYQGILTDADETALTALSASPVLSALLDAVQLEARRFTRVAGHMATLQSALGLTADDITRVLAAAGTSPEDAELSIANVSLLYRHGALAKALKLSVREVIALARLAGVDPFAAVAPDPLATLADDRPFTQTLRFIDVATEVKATGLAIDDVDYLLRHHVEDAVGRHRADDAGTRAFLKTLGDGIRAIRSEHAVPADPSALGEDTLRQKLGLVLPADVVERFLAMLNGTAEFTVASTRDVAPADRLVATALAGEPSIRAMSYDETLRRQTLTFRGVLLADEKTALNDRLPKPVPPAPHVASPVLADLLDQVEAAAKAFFDTHLKKRPADAQPAGGFLDEADFALLFAPPPAGSTPTQEQQRIRDQRARLAQAFLPFLQERLIRRLIVETLVAQTAADPALVESLVTDTRLLGEPAPATTALLDALTAAGELGLTATLSASPDGANPTTVRVADADTTLTDGAGARIAAGAAVARYAGWLEVAAPGPYRFGVVLGKEIEAELTFDHLADRRFLAGGGGADGAELTDVLDLEAGVPYRFALALSRLNGGDARLVVQSESLPRGPLSRSTLTPDAAIERARRALLLLTKTLQLVQGLGLDERELRYVLTHRADFADVDLTRLPTDEGAGDDAAARALFGQFLRLAAYARLKREVAGGTDDLIAVFETTAIDDVYALLAQITRRDPATVKGTARALFATPAFRDERAVRRLWEALQIVERFGVPVASIVALTSIVSADADFDARFERARDLIKTLKARFAPDAWQHVARPIFDRLRQRQRDALVALILDERGFARLEQLYEYFLIDPGMEPVVQTSRIRLAIGSVQLFIQRCLLNLEPQVHPSTILAKQWEWMKRYRVWEANRKIFLFPENWLEPEFRDDKTHLFTELEGSLFQGDVSDDLVEDALLAYLKKLEELARLDVVAMHLEDRADPAQNTLHVIGRTFSDPPKYFYRRYAHEMWTPWEPVTAEIQGNHLAPVVWRDRLYLFWVTFLEKPDENAAVGTSTGSTSLGALTPAQVATDLVAIHAQKKVQVDLHWSEYVHGAWSTRESGGAAAATFLVDKSFDASSVFIHASKERSQATGDPAADAASEPVESGEEGGVFIHLGGVIAKAFYLAGRNAVPELRAAGAAPPNPYTAKTAAATRYSGTNPLTVRFTERVTTEDGQDAVPTQVDAQILGAGGAYTLLPCDDAISLGAPADVGKDASDPAAVAAAIERGLPEIASLMQPFFYQDPMQTFFVEPDVAERTVEDWQEWVTRTTTTETDWDDPSWWKDLEVAPVIPPKELIIDAGGPLGPGDPVPDFRIDPRSLVALDPKNDWLANPRTGLLFDGGVVAPRGRAEVAVVPAHEVARAAPDSVTPIAVAAGSAVAAGGAVVATQPNALERAGLATAATGLNVVGAGGLNAVLAGNLTNVGRAGLAASGRGNRGSIMSGAPSKGPQIQAFHGYLDKEIVYLPPRQRGPRVTTTTTETKQLKHFVVQERDVSYRFTPHFHPYVDELVRRLLRGSTAGLQRADTEYVADDTSIPGSVDVVADANTAATIAARSRVVLLADTQLTSADGHAIAMQAGMQFELENDVAATLVDGADATLIAGMTHTPPKDTAFVATQDTPATLGRDTKATLGAAAQVQLHDTAATIPATTAVAVLAGATATIASGGRLTLVRSLPRPRLWSDGFQGRYAPTYLVQRPYPVKDLDFTSSGAYAVYNWELFFHVPLTIAIHLSKNQRFAEAQRWFHYVFDPTDDSDGPTPERFWKVRPFQYDRRSRRSRRSSSTSRPTRIRSCATRPCAASRRGRTAPFRPHVVARYRQQAYMYKTVMAYLDNLIAWGDSLFRQDTGEAIDEALSSTCSPPTSSARGRSRCRRRAPSDRRPTTTCAATSSSSARWCARSRPTSASTSRRSRATAAATALGSRPCAASARRSTSACRATTSCSATGTPSPTGCSRSATA